MTVTFRIDRFASFTDDKFATLTYIFYKNPKQPINDPIFDRRIFRHFGIKKRNMNILNRDTYDIVMDKLHVLSLKMMQKQAMSEYRYNVTDINVKSSQADVVQTVISFSLDRFSSFFYQALGDVSEIPIDETIF